MVSMAASKRTVECFLWLVNSTGMLRPSMSSGAVKQAWEIVHHEASDGWTPSKARDKDTQAAQDDKKSAKKKNIRKEESAAEEQASLGKSGSQSSLAWRAWGAGHGRAMDKAGSGAFDERGLWVLRRVSTIFAVRKEKLDKFLQLLGEDANSSRVLNHFLNEVEVPAVFFHLSASGESCSVSTELPTAAQLKKKASVCYTLWPAGVPDNPLGLKLDTEFMSLLAPGLKEVGSEMPVFDFKAGAMDIKVPMIFSFRRLVKPGYYYNTSEFVFSLTADVLGRAELLIEPGKEVGQPQRLKAHATLMGASNLQQGTSKAGPVNLMMASQLLAVVRQPAEARALHAGDPNGAFMLSNVNTNISSGGVYFLSDLTMNWTWDRQKVMSLINGVSTQQPAAIEQSPEDPVLP
ncbi:hypothetical protein AK812_SmicGene25351 [Symbiodinium microadriaticum]|uniref:Uncharacterized protein n=1 Tax=Symbiodinium microadriaticum TaxID=2951 RepID=A0A1Q9DCC2_SYMMI|nr:hypothetical protein AK812_SmicGene25351 [Symbiodinium microadriaticum]